MIGPSSARPPMREECLRSFAADIIEHRLRGIQAFDVRPNLVLYQELSRLTDAEQVRLEALVKSIWKATGAAGPRGMIATVTGETDSPEPISFTRPATPPKLPLLPPQPKFPFDRNTILLIYVIAALLVTLACQAAYDRITERTTAIYDSRIVPSD